MQPFLIYKTIVPSSYTVWAAANPGGGRQLKPSQTWVINTDPNNYDSGCIWARTKCNFTVETHNKCESRDCGGVLLCESEGGAPFNSAYYALNQSSNMDYFGISLLKGFNVPMEFNLTISTSGCTLGTGVKCSADINRLCPTELKDPGGCHHPCTVFSNDQFCCLGPNITRGNCSPTAYSKIFKDVCPSVYINLYYDEETGIFSCPTGTDYKIVFCP